MSDAMTPDQSKEARKAKVAEGLKAFGHLLVVDVLPQVAKIVFPMIVAYFTKKGIDTGLNSGESSNVAN